MKQVNRVLVVTTLIAAVAVMAAHTTIAKAVYAALPIPSGEIAAYEKAMYAYYVG